MKTQQDKTKYLQKYIDNFIQDQSKEEYHCPSGLNAYERLKLHELANFAQLYHFSVGEGKNRHVVLRKTPLEKPPVAQGQGNVTNSRVVPPVQYVVQGPGTPSHNQTSTSNSRVVPPVIAQGPGTPNLTNTNSEKIGTSSQMIQSDQSNPMVCTVFYN